VAAATAGEDVSVVFGDIADARLSVVATANGPMIHCIAYPGMDLRDLLVTAVLNHSEPHEAADIITSALAEHLSTFGEFPDVQAVHEPSSGAIPRFGWRTEFDASGFESWDGFWAAHDRSAIGRVCGLVSLEGDGSLVTDKVFDRFVGHGLPVVRCQVCEHPLTHRHPMWPGVWTSIEPETGPVCQPQQGYRPDFDDLAEYDRIDIASGHRPRPGDLRNGQMSGVEVRAAGCVSASA
jgi:hypothetical protein